MSVGALIAIGLVAIALLLVMVMVLEWPAFLSLLIVSVITALLSGIPVAEIVPTMISGMGGTLGSVALLVGLGSMLGGVIEKTGGAEVVANWAVHRLGKDRIGPALLIASGLVGIPIFFDVAFIILVPIIFSFAKAAGHKNAVVLGAPVAVFMVFIHNLVPPHPGVTGSTTLLRESTLGLVTVTGILIAIPIGFLVYFVSKKITAADFNISPEIEKRYADTGAATFDSDASGAHTMVTETGVTVRKPSAGLVIGMILLPILMITAGTVGAIFLEEGSQALAIVSFIGAPAFALIVATLLAMLILGNMHGWKRKKLSDLMDAALGPSAVVILVTGAGGVFARVLTESGIGEAVSNSFIGAGVPILFLAFLLATVFKVAQGSGTVATLTAAGLVQATVEAGAYTDFQVVLIILAIGCGSVALSHINDSGFWIATRFLGLDVAGGLRTWTLMATIAGWTGMIIISLLWLIA